jgi:hypothetical protein
MSQNSIPDRMRVEIYQFQFYDVLSDKFVKSERWGIESTIKEINGIKIGESTSVDPSVIENTDYPGLTRVGYMPTDVNSR